MLTNNLLYVRTIDLLTYLFHLLTPFIQEETEPERVCIIPTGFIH